MIIGLSGLRDDGTAAGAGKDVVARFLVQDHCFEHMSFASSLKMFCMQVFGWSRPQVYGDEKETPDPRTGVVPRVGMQKVGDAVRDVWTDAFVECALREARERLSFSRSDGVVFSDVRYPNEAQAIKDAGGVVWQVVRPGARLCGGAAKHKSENSMVGWKFDRVLDNQDGPLEDLRALVARAIGGKL